MVSLLIFVFAVRAARDPDQAMVCKNPAVLSARSAAIILLLGGPPLLPLGCKNSVSLFSCGNALFVIYFTYMTKCACV